MTNNSTVELSIEKVKQLMNQHKLTINSIFYKSYSGRKEQTTFLHYAIETQNIKLIDWLLAQKVDVNNAGHPFYGAPIISALIYKDLDTVRKLVKHGADINIRQPELGYTPLYRAKHIPGNSAAKFLIENGANVNMEIATSERLKGYSPLQFYAKMRNVEMVNLMLTKGAVVNHKSADNNTPLICAIQENNENLEIINLLLDCGADIHHKSSYGYTPLHHAVPFSKLETIKLLLDRGADVNCKTNNGETPLIRVAQYGQNRQKLIKMLFEYGAEIHCTYRYIDDELTPLHMALWPSQLDVIKLFFVLYEPATAAKLLTGIKKQSLLHFALSSGLRDSRELLDFLLNAGVDVNLEDNDGKLAIDYSAQHSKQEGHLIMRKHIVKLISANLPVCQRNEDAIGDGLEEFAADCCEEVNKMKNTKIGDVLTTFYDVLHVSEHKLTIKVKFLRNDFQNKDKLCEMFPLYGGMLYFKLSEAQKRMKRCEKAEEKLEEICICCDVPYVFFRELFNYLNISDLRKIIGEKILDPSNMMNL